MRQERWYEFLYYTEIINLLGTRSVCRWGSRWRSRCRRAKSKGGFSSWGVAMWWGHISTHTVHPLGTGPLFMLDIIPLSKHTHFARSLNVHLFCLCTYFRVQQYNTYTQCALHWILYPLSRVTQVIWLQPMSSNCNQPNDLSLGPENSMMI